MQPHSLGTITIGIDQTPAQRDAHLRHGRYPKSTVLPDTITPACPKVRVADLPEGFLPEKYFHPMEQNQLAKHCCRHPENHFIEAFKSYPDEVAPDIYIFHCDKCGKKNRRFCVGMHDTRPVWDAK